MFTFEIPQRRQLRRQIALLGVAALVVLSTEAFGNSEPAEPGDTFVAGVESRIPEGLSLYAVDNFRFELWRFFRPPPGGGDPDYSFVANRLRLGIQYERSGFGFHFAGQYVQLGSVPGNAGGAGRPGGALGTGALYFAHSREKSPEAFQVKYLSARLRNPFDVGLDLTLGRFGYSSGAELTSSSTRIQALKKNRIADRLIGEFGWSHFQRSFDGAWLRWDHDLGQASVAWLRPTEGGFEDGGNRRIDAIDLVAAAYTMKQEEVSGTELQTFYYYYDDERRVRARVDNTGLPAPGRQDISIHTFGGHAVGVWTLGPGELDVLGWGALQFGRWFELDHRAGAIAAEVGYRFDRPWKPWLRIGTFASSGDRYSFDSDHETFFQMLPTARLYSLTTAYNLMNNTDTFIELRLSPIPQLTLRTSVHDLRLSERNDRWYGGAGATQEQGRIFGFGGRPSGGSSHLGTVAEVTAVYRPTKWLTLHAYYGHLWGGKVVRTTFTDDDLDFFFLEFTLRLGLRGRGKSPSG